MPRKLLILVICCIALGSLAAPVAAQSTDTPTNNSTTTATASSSSTNSTALLVVDERTNLVAKSYDRSTGTLTLTFESDRYTPVSLLVVQDTEASTGTATYQQSYLQPGERTEVQITAPPNSRVWISTDLSQEAGQIHFVRTSEGGSLIGGPWTASDVRDAGAASAVGVALMVLYRLVLEHSAINKDGERVA
jgi:hypothetical protein